MKIYNKFFTIALASLALLSCTKEGGVAEPGAVISDDAQKLYFVSDAASQTFELDPTDDKVFTFTIARINATTAYTGDLTISYTVDGEIGSDSSLFSATSFEFAVNEYETTAQIDFTNAEVGLPYAVEIGFADASNVSTYDDIATPTCTYEFTVVKWNIVTENATFVDSVMFCWWGWGSVTMTGVTVYERDDKPGYFRMLDPYYNDDFATWWYEVTIEASQLVTDGYLTLGQEFIIDATDPDNVWIPYTNTGFNTGWGYGYHIISSYCSDAGWSTSTSYYGTYDAESGVISFPASGLVATLSEYGSNLANTDGDTALYLK